MKFPSILRPHYIVMAFFSCFLIAVSYFYTPAEIHQDNDVSYYPSRESVRLIAFDHNESLASLYWISCLIQLGDVLITEREFLWFTHIIDLITTLDSDLYMPYYFLGGIIQQERSDTTDFPVLERGISKFQHDWQLSLFLAQRVVQVNSDYQRAANLLLPFSNSENVPLYIRRMANSYKEKVLPVEESLKLMLLDYYNPDYRPYKTALVKRIESMLLSPQNTVAPILNSQEIREPKDVERIIEMLLKKNDSLLTEISPKKNKVVP